MVGRKIDWRSVVVTAVMATSGIHNSMAAPVPFAIPAEGPIAFRRDKLPIDVETMIQLSTDLLNLSQNQSLETPEDRRTVAQILALAIALNPANEDARQAVITASDKAKQPKEETVDPQSQDRIWNVLTWLSKPEAGTDGNALAAYLGDVIAKADPRRMEATPLLQAGEKGAWAPWVADISAFRIAQAIEKKPVEEHDMPVEEKLVPPESPATKVIIEKASLSTPLWTQDPTTGQDVLLPVVIQMQVLNESAAEGEKTKPMTFTVLNTPENAQLIRMNRTAHAVLTKQFGTLPSDSRVTFEIADGKPYVSSKNADAFSAPAVVLMGAALSGKAPTGNVIGRIEKDGSLKSTPDIWYRLRALTSGPGGRLVIPTDAAEWLPWFLTLDEPEFFLKYDILLADNVQELEERSAEKTEAPLSEALVRFQDVRSKSGDFPINTYLANRFVRQRLSEITAQTPYYASANLLTMQAAGERRAKLSRTVLALELRQIIEPFNWIRAKPASELDMGQVDAAYEQMKASVDRLERYSQDKDLVDLVRDVITNVRTFSRAVRINAGRDRGPAAIDEAFTTLRKDHRKVISTLDLQISGKGNEAEKKEDEE